MAKKTVKTYVPVLQRVDTLDGGSTNEYMVRDDAVVVFTCPLCGKYNSIPSRHIKDGRIQHVRCNNGKCEGTGTVELKGWKGGKA